MFIGTINTQNQILNTTAINRTTARQSEALYGKKASEENQDRLILSSSGKNQSLIEQLMKQKEFLQERKQSLMDSASENGSGSLEQLKEYEKQLKAIDEQIAELQAQQASETEEEEGDKTGRIYEKPQTKEEAMQAQINGLTALAADSKQTQVLSASKERLEGQTRVLKAEIHSGKGNIEKKLEEVSKLEEKSGRLNSEIGDKLKENSRTLRDIQDSQEEDSESEGIYPDSQ